MSEVRSGFATLASLRAHVESTHDLRAAERLAICEALQSSNHVGGVFVVLGLPLEPSVLPMAEPEPDPSRSVETFSEAAEREARERQAAFETGHRSGVCSALCWVIGRRDLATHDALRHKNTATALRARAFASGLDAAVDVLASSVSASSAS